MLRFQTKTRYGAHEVYGPDADVAVVVNNLIAELETELFDEPDLEHEQVAN